jgi:hypothetical protein
VASNTELNRRRIEIAQAVRLNRPDAEREARRAYAELKAQTVLERAQQKAREILDAAK